MKGRVTRIGEIATVAAGGTPTRGVAKYYGGSIAWIKTLDLNGGTVIESQERITSEGLRSIRGCVNLPGTVMIAMYGGAGTIGKSGMLSIEAATNQAVASILPNPAIFDSRFLHYQLRYLRGDWMQFSQGNRKDPNINKSVVENMPIWLPAKAGVQRDIANRLDAQFAELEIARQAAQTQRQDIALLRTRALHDVFASIDDAPRKVLGDHAPTTSGSTPPRGNKRYWEPAEIPWVKTGEVAFAAITQTEEAVSKAALAECSLTLLPPKTVLVAMYGQGKTRGQSAILEKAATTNQACFAILPNDTWDSEFLYNWLVASYADLRNLSADRGGNQANLNGALLKSLEIPAPARQRQRQVVHHINKIRSDMDALVAANAASMAELAQLPQRLLAQAFGDTA